VLEPPREPFGSYTIVQDAEGLEALARELAEAP